MAVNKIEALAEIRIKANGSVIAWVSYESRDSVTDTLGYTVRVAVELEGEQETPLLELKSKAEQRARAILAEVSSYASEL